MRSVAPASWRLCLPSNTRFTSYVRLPWHPTTPIVSFSDSVVLHGDPVPDALALVDVVPFGLAASAGVVDVAPEPGMRERVDDAAEALPAELDPPVRLERPLYRRGRRSGGPGRRAHGGRPDEAGQGEEEHADRCPSTEHGASVADVVGARERSWRLRVGIVREQTTGHPDPEERPSRERHDHRRVPIEDRSRQPR